MEVKPYQVQVAEETLQDLRARLQRTQWPDEVEDADQSRSCSGS